MEKTFDYFGKLMKIFLLACFAVVDVISPVVHILSFPVDLSHLRKSVLEFPACSHLSLPAASVHDVQRLFSA